MFANLMGEPTLEERDQFTNALPGVVYEFRVGEDGAWNFTYLSQGITSLCGLAREAVLKDTNVLLQRLPLEDRPAFYASVQEAVSTRKPWHHEARIQAMDGGVRWFRAQASARLSPDGTVSWSGLVLDVTDLREALQRESEALAASRRAEAALRESEKRYRLLAENMADMVFTLDMETLQYVYTSPSAQALRASRGATTAAFEDAVPEDVAGPLKAALKARASEFRAGSSPAGHNYTDQFCYAQGTQDEMWTEVHSRFFLDETTGHVCNTGVVRDITHRKRAELHEQGRARVLELLSNGAPLSTVLGALVLGVEQANAGALCTVMLLDSDGRRLTSVAAPSLPECYRTGGSQVPVGAGVGPCPAAAAAGERVIVPDIQAHPDWAEFKEMARQASLAACWSQPIRSSSGAVLGTFAMYRTTPRSPVDSDLRLLEECAHLASIAVERTRNTEALRNSEKVFRALFERSMVGMARTGADRRWLEVNEALCTTLGYPRDELLRRTWDELTHPDDRAKDMALFDQMLRGENDGYALDKRFVRKDGQVVDAHIAVRLVRKESGAVDFVAALVEDITERKEAEADRLILGKLESTGILAGGIAHDFNNLLTALIMNVELAQLNAGSAEDVRPYLVDARSAAMSAKSLTQQLITFAKGGVTARALVDLTPVIREAMAVALSGSNVRGDLTVGSGLWQAQVDEAQVGQVVRNLVLNAREAMPHGGVVTLRVENVFLGETNHLSLRAGEYLQLSVVDHGVGIPGDVLPRVFDPYFSTKERGAQKGMGLGLTICHSVVHKHGGAISVESTVGAGTSVHVYLPATHPDAARATLPPTRSAVASRRVLLMDDEKLMRDVARKTIERMGCTVVSAADGQAAVELYAHALTAGERFDVVLLDLTVRGGMGGLEAMQAIRALDPRAHGVVMSGYAQDEVVRDPTHHGFVGALVKPFDIGALRQALTRALESAGRPG